MVGQGPDTDLEQEKTEKEHKSEGEKSMEEKIGREDAAKEKFPYRDPSHVSQYRNGENIKKNLDQPTTQTVRGTVEGRIEGVSPDRFEPLSQDRIRSLFEKFLADHGVKPSADQLFRDIRPELPEFILIPDQRICDPIPLFDGCHVRAAFLETAK